MTLEARKYKAQVLLIAGFAIATPFGRMILNMFEVEFDLTMSLRLFLTLLASAILLLLGIIIVTRGLIHLE